MEAEKGQSEGERYRGVAEHRFALHHIQPKW